MNVSFNGKVFLAGSTNYLSKKNEVNKLKKYADKKNCDVIVLNRNNYTNGMGEYHTLIVKGNNITGENHFFSKIFDFTSSDPGYMPASEINISV